MQSIYEAITGYVYEAGTTVRPIEFLHSRKSFRPEAHGQESTVKDGTESRRGLPCTNRSKPSKCGWSGERTEAAGLALRSDRVKGVTAYSLRSAVWLMSLTCCQPSPATLLFAHFSSSLYFIPVTNELWDQKYGWLFWVLRQLSGSLTLWRCMSRQV